MFGLSMTMNFRLNWDSGELGCWGTKWHSTFQLVTGDVVTGDVFQGTGYGVLGTASNEVGSAKSGISLKTDSRLLTADFVY